MNDKVINCHFEQNFIMKKKIIHGNLAHPFNVNKKYSPQKHIQIETKIFKVTDHFC